MKDKKRRIEGFAFFDAKGISEHLAKMAQKGWMLEKVGSFFWTYRRIEPTTLHFSVSYYAKASEFDPEPSEEQKTFQEFCEHTGWNLVCTFGQMQVFYNEQENPIPIETEPDLELEAIHAAAKKNLIPVYLVDIGIAFSQILIFFVSLKQDPISLLSSTMRMFPAFSFLLLGVEAGAELISYVRWYKKSKKAVEYGPLPEVKSRAKVKTLISLIVLMGLLVWMFDLMMRGDKQLKFIALLMLAYMPLLYLIVVQIKNFLKQKKAPRGMNRTTTLVSSFVCSFALIAVIVQITLWSSSHGFFANKEETYEYQGQTWVIYQDTLPLKLEDLTETPYHSYICRLEVEESFLLKRQHASQSPRFDAPDYRNIPHFEYTIVEIKAPFLYKWCKDSLMQIDPIFEEDYIMQAMPSWGADEVYRLYDEQYGYRNDYILCYDDTLVQIRFGWEPTPEQMQIVGQRLGKIFPA